MPLRREGWTAIPLLYGWSYVHAGGWVVTDHNGPMEGRAVCIAGPDAGLILTAELGLPFFSAVQAMQAVERRMSS